MADLRAIAERYMEAFHKAAEEERLAPTRLPSLTEAIFSAARCMLPNGRRHSHQRRIPKIALGEAEQRLLAAERALAGAGRFDDLYAIIANELRQVRSIGPLTIYDIATRIGSHLGWQPERVYLHAGTRVGANAIGVKGRNGVPVRIDTFPAELRVLSAYHLENLLCIFKAELAGAPLPPEMPKGCGDPLLGASCNPKGRWKRSSSRVC